MLHSNDKMSCKIAMQLIGNISIATASRYISYAKKHYNKESHQILTVEEFCNYYGVKY